MPTEQLILRRVFPVPVTFADLRRAHEVLVVKRYGICSHLAFLAIGVGGVDWHAAIKEATGALDEVYAVIDGREVRVATVCAKQDAESVNWCGAWPANSGVMFRAMESLLIKADEAGYWQRPHEVRHDLEESQMSHKTIVRSLAAQIERGDDRNGADTALVKPAITGRLVTVGQITTCDNDCADSGDYNFTTMSGALIVMDDDSVRAAAGLFGKVIEIRGVG